VNLRIRLLVVLLAAALAPAAAFAAVPATDEPDRDAEGEPSGPDRLAPALEQRIRGKAPLGDVQIDVFWSHGGRATTARIFGNGIGVWKREKQFRLSRAQVLDLLKVIERARFGAMPDQFGEDEEGAEHEKNEGPRLKGQLVVRAGAVRKGALQLVDGEQSKELARLIERILKLCEGPARKGIGAASMGEALRLLAAGTLAPELLEVTAQRRPDPKAPEGSGAGWTLRIAGLRVSEEPDRSLVLSDKSFHELAALLLDAAPESLPQSLYAASYTDVTVAILKYSRTIAGRRFLGMTPETHGEQQAAFDRITGALEALHARVEKDGASP
jgi:hypothetical protein